MVLKTAMPQQQAGRNLNSIPNAPALSQAHQSCIDDDIICQIDSPSIDIDGDGVEYSFEWTLADGTIIQNTLTQTLMM